MDIITDPALRQLLIDERQTHIMRICSIERALGLETCIATKRKKPPIEQSTGSYDAPAADYFQPFGVKTG